MGANGAASHKILEHYPILVRNHRRAPFALPDFRAPLSAETVRLDDRLIQAAIAGVDLHPDRHSYQDL